VPVVFLIAIVVFSSHLLRRDRPGGELAYEHADHAPLDLGPVSAADIACSARPPPLWGATTCR